MDGVLPYFYFVRTLPINSPSIIYGIKNTVTINVIIIN